jgi:hypothetical protein
VEGTCALQFPLPAPSPCSPPQCPVHVVVTYFRAQRLRRSGESPRPIASVRHEHLSSHKRRREISQAYRSRCQLPVSAIDKRSSMCLTLKDFPDFPASKPPVNAVARCCCFCLGHFTKQISTCTSPLPDVMHHRTPSMHETGLPFSPHAAYLSMHVLPILNHHPITQQHHTTDLLNLARKPSARHWARLPNYPYRRR